MTPLRSLLPVAVLTAGLAACGGEPQHFNMNDVSVPEGPNR
ncbi:MAG: hypothetical protein WB783_20270 [Arenicellales bacterium]